MKDAASWWEALFGNQDITPEQELVLWVQKWKKKGLTDIELAGWLKAMHGQLDTATRVQKREDRNDDWKP